MEVLSKDIIEKRIVPHLSTGNRGPDCGVSSVNIVEAIFHRLKTGTQWRFLPVHQFFEAGSITSGVAYITITENG